MARRQVCFIFSLLLPCASGQTCDAEASTGPGCGAPTMAWHEEAQAIPVASSWVQAKICIQPSPVVVIALHPWGPLGGSMDDPHPATAVRLFGSAGCSTARFNFRRGIGSGATSVEDVRAVASWFTEPTAENGDRKLASQVLIVGYSYGSIIGAAAAAEIPAAVGYAAIGPPIDYSWALYVFNAGHLRKQAADSQGRPKLLMVGTKDQFCSVTSFQSLVDELPEPKESLVLDGVDHFGAFRSLPKVLSQWVTSAFGVSSLEEFAKGVPAALAQQAQRL